MHRRLSNSKTLACVYCLIVKVFLGRLLFYSLSEILLPLMTSGIYVSVLVISDPYVQIFLFALSDYAI